MRSLSLAFAVVCFSAAVPSALAVEWDAAIRNVEKASRDYFEYVRNKGGDTWVGTAFNGYEYDRHQCAIVGRMLGLQDVIVELESMPYPPMDGSVEDHQLLIFAVSLDSWAIAAQRAVDMDDAGRRSVWNLDCVGHLGISTEHYIGNAKPEAQFRAEEGTLFVYGDIDFGFYERFKSALANATGITEIALGSGGGSVRDAILAGYEVRLQGLSTTIYGNCYSACPLVFMGGVERRIWASTSSLGFHQISRGQEAVPFDDDIYMVTVRYLKPMSIDPAVVITWMTSAAPADMYEPPVEDLCPPGVATWVQRVCGF